MGYYTSRPDNAARRGTAAQRMLKVSITLPNSTKITLESEEPDMLRQVVELVLGDLPRELAQAGPNSSENTSGVPVFEKGISVIHAPATSAPEPVAAEPGDSPQAPPDGNPETAIPSRTLNRTHRSPSTRRPVDQADPTAQLEAPNIRRSKEQGDLFARFCGSANPLGDMRRVVIAAEAAHRFMGMASVDAAELARLFALAGWQLPHDFTQTLRNAARGKFRWLERVPGRTGRYSVTDLGRAKTLGE